MYCRLCAIIGEFLNLRDYKMKVRNSVRSLMRRHRENKMVRRKGRVYIINKRNPRFKARQG